MRKQDIIRIINEEVNLALDEQEKQLYKVVDDKGKQIKPDESSDVEGLIKKIATKLAAKNPKWSVEKINEMYDPIYDSMIPEIAAMLAAGIAGVIKAFKYLKSKGLNDQTIISILNKAKEKVKGNVNENEGMTKSLKDILLEIGEGVTPYEFRGGFSKKYRDGGKEYVYKFDAPTASYDVDILVQPLVDDDDAIEWVPPEIMKKVRYGSEVADISFSTETGKLEVNDYQELFRVMSTVVATIKDLIKKEPAVKVIKYTAIKAEKEIDSTAITKRDKLYQAYIKKQIPNAKVVMELGATYIALP